jgi:hypothetical protein
MIPPLPYPPPRVVYQDKIVEKKVFVDKPLPPKTVYVDREVIVEKEVPVEKIVEREVEVVKIEYRDPPPVAADPYRTFTWSFWRIRITFGWRLDNQQNQA